MTTLADPEASRAVLIGSYQYSSLEELAAVANNLAALRSALTDPALWGLPSENCTVITDPTHAHEVIEALNTAAGQATDTLLFYFSGHGLVDHTNDDELYLALPGSDPGRVDRTSVPWTWVRREMHESEALRKVAILDCCYSGRALGKWMGDDADITELLEVEGTCILTATARTRRALAPLDAEYTAFTGELIAALTKGIPDGPELLDMDSIYKRVKSRMRAKDLPIPQQSQLDRGGNIALVHNKAFRPKPVIPPPVVSPPKPAPPPQVARVETAAPVPKSMLLTPSEPVLSRPDPFPRRGPLAGLLESRTAKPWHERLRPTEKLSIAQRKKPSRRENQGAVYGAVFLTAVWLGLLFGIDRYAGLNLWLTGTLVTGLLALAFAPFASREWYTGFVLVTFFVFEVFAIAEAVFAPNWLARGMAIAMAIVFFFVMGTLVSIPADLDRFHADVAAWREEGPAVDAARAKRWLTASPLQAENVALAEQITIIPAVRFAEAGEPFDFLAVAGRNVLLISLVRWPSGNYTRLSGTPHEVLRDGVPAPLIADQLALISASLKEWRMPVRAGRGASLRALLVVDPSESSGASGVNLGFTADGDIRITTRERFADVAGEFLIAYQNSLDATVLGHIRLRLGSGSAVSSRR